MFARFLKTVLATAAVFVPVWIKHQWPTETTQLFAFALYAIAIGLINFFAVFDPDPRFDRIFKPTLDSLFDKIVPILPAEGDTPERPTYRVHVFRPRGIWPVQWLEMAYTYKSDQHEPDFGICWWCFFGHWRQGLVWSVYAKSAIASYVKPEGPEGDSDSQLKKQFGLTKNQVDRTRRVAGILAFPLRYADIKKGRAINPKVRAVLSIDTFDRSQAIALEGIKNDIDAGGGRDWVEIVDRTAIYF